MAEGYRKPQTLHEYQTLAKTVLPTPYFNYYIFPGPSGHTYNDSMEAFKRYRFRPLVLCDVSVRDLTTTMLGQPVSLPIGVAPSALHRYAHNDGEIATAKGAAAAGTILIQSCFSNKLVSEVADAVPDGIRWMQTYIWKDRRITEYCIRKAEAAGYKAVVLTVDSPWTAVNFGVDPRNLQNNAMCFDREEFSYPNMDLGTEEQENAKRKGDKHLTWYYSAQYNPSVTWEDIKWVKSVTSLPIVCKGILTDRAARQAADAGVEGIIVSAHGGRQLDGVPAPIDALPEVVEAVRGRNVEVYMDGGVRTGSDVLKALSRGVKAVFVGRPVLWGLASGGASGVEHVLNILRNELDSAMGLCGCSDVKNIPSDVVVHDSHYNTPKHRL